MLGFPQFAYNYSSEFSSLLMKGFNCFSSNSILDEQKCSILLLELFFTFITQTITRNSIICLKVALVEVLANLNVGEF